MMIGCFVWCSLVVNNFIYVDVFVYLVVVILNGVGILILEIVILIGKCKWIGCFLVIVVLIKCGILVVVFLGVI